MRNDQKQQQAKYNNVENRRRTLSSRPLLLLHGNNTNNTNNREVSRLQLRQRTSYLQFFFCIILITSALFCTFGTNYLFFMFAAEDVHQNTKMVFQQSPNHQLLPLRASFHVQNPPQSSAAVIKNDFPTTRSSRSSRRRNDIIAAAINDDNTTERMALENIGNNIRKQQGQIMYQLLAQTQRQQPYLQDEEIPLHHRILSDKGGNNNPMMVPFPPESLLERLLGDIRGYYDHHHDPSRTTSCHLPQLASSETTKYTVLAVVTSPGNSSNSHDNNKGWIRTVFVNCLTWMADSKMVDSIFILLPPETLSLLQENKAYGQRLFAWDAQSHHPVHLIFEVNFWNALEQFRNRVDGYHAVLTTEMRVGDMPNEIIGSNTTMYMSHPPDAILWVRGEEKWMGNRPGIHNGFAMWKKRPSGLVTNLAWQFQYNKVDAAAAAAASTADDDPSALAVRRVDATTLDEVPTTEPGPVIADLGSGTFMHRSYICLALHPALISIREETMDDWDASRFLVSTLFSMSIPAAESSSPSPRTTNHLRGTQEGATVGLERSSTFSRDIRFFSVYSNPDKE